MENSIQMEKNAKPPDLTLIVEGETLHVQKEVLAESSFYFKAMFSIDMVESTADKVKIHEVSANVLKQLISFAYTKELALSVDDAIDLIGGASMLQFTEVVKLCHERLLSGIDPNNCLCIMHLADTNGFDQLFNKAKVYALWYFEQVVHSNDFLGLPYDLLVDYVRSPAINVTSEFTVFLALSLWIRHAPQDREQYFPSLFDHIHTSALSDSELRLILNGDVINKFSQCKTAVEVLLAPPIFCSSGPSTQCHGQNDEFAQRKRRKSEKSIIAFRKVPTVMWTVGGNFMDSEERWANKDVLEFNMDTLNFTQIAPLPMFKSGNAWGYRACSVGKDLYVIGGEIKHGIRPTWSEEVWKYDTFDQCWSVVGKLDQPRRHHSLVSHQDHIYVVGGFGKHRIMLNTAVRFHTVLGTWEELPSLPSAVFSAALCVCNNHLYCIKNLVYYLTPGATEWTVVKQSLPCDMGIQCALPRGDKIYLLGTHVKRLLEFDTVTNAYTDLGSFQNAMGQACLYEDKIYVFGGEDGENIESYDLCTKEFCVVAKLQHCMYNHSVVVLPKYPKFRPHVT